MIPKHKYYGIRPWTRHGLVLMIAGLAYVGIGITYAFGKPGPSRTAALDIALRWMSLESWGFIFMLVGVLAVLSSRWPPFSRTWGYTVLTGMAAAWSAFYTAGILLSDSRASHLSGAFVWGLLAFMWWAISGLLNPDKTEEEEWIQLP